MAGFHILGNYQDLVIRTVIRNGINSDGVRFCGVWYVGTDGDKLSCLSKAIMMGIKDVC